MAIELVDFASLKRHLGLTEDTIDAYPDLKVIRESVTTAIETYLGRSLESTSRTETIYVGEILKAMVSLKAIPVASVTSVAVDTDDIDETLTSDDYRVTRYGVKLYSPVKNGTVTVTYTGGISATTDVLKRAALLQTIYEFQSKDNLGVETVTTEGGTITRPPLGLLSEVKRVLSSEMHPLKWV